MSVQVYRGGKVCGLIVALSAEFCAEQGLKGGEHFAALLGDERSEGLLRLERCEPTGETFAAIPSSGGPRGGSSGGIFLRLSAIDGMSEVHVKGVPAEYEIVTAKPWTIEIRLPEVIFATAEPLLGQPRVDPPMPPARVGPKALGKHKPGGSVFKKDD